MTAINLNFSEAGSLAAREPRGVTLPQGLAEFMAEAMQVLKGMALPLGGRAPELDEHLRRDLGLR